MAALSERTGTAAEACVDALKEGAELTVGDEADAEDLARPYLRRARSDRERHIPTLGFEQTTHDLAAARHATLRVLGVTSDDHPFQFAVFVAPDFTELVACLGFNQA